MSTSRHSILETTASSIRTLLDETADEGVPWTEADLADVLLHQWSAPLSLDLGGLEEAAAAHVTMLATSKGLLVKSFGDLLRHPNPPLELLKMTKEFAKRHLYSPLSTISHDVARVLYFASISVALGRCGARISALSDDDIASGIAWALSRDWLCEDARDVLSSGLDALKDTGNNA